MMQTWKYPPRKEKLIVPYSRNEVGLYMLISTLADIALSVILCGANVK